MWHFGKHRHKLLLFRNCKTVCQLWDTSQIKHHAHSHFLTHFFSPFFTHLLNFVLQKKEGKTPTHDIHNSHALSKLCRRTQSNVIFIWDLNPKFGSRCTNTQKEASIIKALVGPGERRSLFQIPELPHWYHSVHFCSCNSIVCPLNTTMAWPHWSWCRHTVEKMINTAAHWRGSILQCIASIWSCFHCHAVL